MKRHQHDRPTKPLTKRAGLSKGKAYRRIIGKLVVDGIHGREYFLHATKGYRSYRLGGP